MSNPAAVAEAERVAKDVARVVEAERTLAAVGSVSGSGLAGIAGALLGSVAFVLLHDLAAPNYVRVVLAVGLAVAVTTHVELLIVRKRLQAAITLLQIRASR